MPSLTYGAGLFIFQTCKPSENDCSCLPHPLRSKMCRAAAGDRGPCQHPAQKPPSLPAGHPSVIRWTAHLATEAPAPSPCPPSLPARQHPQNTHQNTAVASVAQFPSPGPAGDRDRYSHHFTATLPRYLAELILGSPLPAPGPPVLATPSHAACWWTRWWTRWWGTGSGHSDSAVREPIPEPRSRLRVTSVSHGSFRGRIGYTGMPFGCQQVHHLRCCHYSALGSYRR